MTWTKLGSEFLLDPHVLSVPRSARLLHIEATCWSNQYGTDGRIPRVMLARLTDDPDPAGSAAALVEAGLWDADDTDFTLLDFLDAQPSAADVERMKALSRDRQRRQRQHRNGDHSGCDPRYCHAARTDGAGSENVPVTRDERVSHDAPYRTDPTRSDPSRKGEVSVSGRAAGSGPDGPDAGASGRRPSPAEGVKDNPASAGRHGGLPAGVTKTGKDAWVFRPGGGVS